MCVKLFFLCIATLFYFHSLESPSSVHLTRVTPTSSSRSPQIWVIAPAAVAPSSPLKLGVGPGVLLWQGRDPLMKAAWRNALLVRLPEHFNAEVNTGVVPIPQYLSLAPKLQRLLFHRVIYLRAVLALLRSDCWHSARRDPHRSYHTQIFELWWLQMTWLHSQSIYDAINCCCQQQDDNFHRIFSPP